MAPQKTRSRISLVLRFLLNTTGSTLTAKYITLQRTGILLGILSYVLLFHSLIWSITNSSNIAVISESLSYFILIFSSIVTVCIIRIHKHTFIRVMQCLNNEPETIIKQTNTQFVSTLKKVFEVILAYEVIYFITGVTASSTNDIELGSQESQYSPGYIPWDYDTPLKYSFGVIYQTLLLFYPFIINYGMYVALTGLYTVINFKFQQLLALIDNLQSVETSILPRDLDKNYHQGMVQVIRSYQDWKNLSKGVASFVGGCSSAVLFSVILCSVWSMSMIAENAITISVKVRSICLLTYTIVQLIMICLLGEYFQEKDSEIGDVIYNTWWYIKSHQSRKTTYFLMLLTQKPSRVRAYGMIPVNMNYSLRVLKIIYSILNLYRDLRILHK